jgi:hypothetical protein
MNYNEAYCVLCSAALDTDWIEIGSNSRSALQRRRSVLPADARQNSVVRNLEGVVVRMRRRRIMRNGQRKGFDTIRALSR